MKKTWRRRNYFIKKELQGKYIFSFFIFVIAGSFFFTAIFSLLSANTLTIAYKHSSLQLGKTPIILLTEILRAHWIFIITGGLLVILISVFLTHRFAGPVYRFEKSLEEMNRGNFSLEIRLRNKDEAKELASMINALNVMLSSRIAELRSLSDAAYDHLENASRSAEKTAAEEVGKAIVLQRQMKEILSGFRIKNDV
ncbi:MAG: methyl-accepting chemotaxis protein [Nitrospirae bacterium]|nr:methyl-accepting chemotaxis protein [Nitrospirota bacterium]